MRILTLCGWTQPADSLAHILPAAHHLDYADFTSHDDLQKHLASHVAYDAIVGWSLGGQIAARAIEAGNLRTSKLVLIAAPYQFIANEKYPQGMEADTHQLFTQNYAADTERTKSRFNGLIAKGDARLKEVMARLSHHPKVLETHRWLHWLDELAHFSADSLNFKAFSPTLLIHGDKDHIVHPANSDRWESAIQGAQKLVIENCAHAPHLHDEVRVKSAIEAFIHG